MSRGAGSSPASGVTTGLLDAGADVGSLQAATKSADEKESARQREFFRMLTAADRAPSQSGR